MQSDSVLQMQRALAACVRALPASAREAFTAPGNRQVVHLSPRVRRQWRQCGGLARDLADRKAALRLRDDLVAMAVRAGVVAHAARDEAWQIARRLVALTREEARVVRMVGSPLFNNFLVHVGARPRGFCYQWTAHFAQGMADLPWRHFRAWWGVANRERVTENNAFVMTVQAAPLGTGIVYDAWRGAGRPWWRQVADDHYRWEVRHAIRALHGGSERVKEPALHESHH